MSSEKDKMMLIKIKCYADIMSESLMKKQLGHDFSGLKGSREYEFQKPKTQSKV